MTAPITCKVPEELRHSLFYSAEETELSPNHLQDWAIVHGAPLFTYELLYWNGLAGYHPWKNSSQPIEDLFNQWVIIKEKAGKLFAERKAEQAKGLMAEGLSLFLSIQFWMHNEPVNIHSWKEKLQSFSHKPVNTEERVSFILSRPALYQSFVQLGELLVELKKQYYKKKIVKKTPKHIEL